MRFFLCAIVLVLMLPFKEAGTSTIRRIYTRNNSSKRDEDRRNILATPRPKKLMTSKNFTTSAGNQALDSVGYHEPPYILESSHELSAEGASDLVEKYKTENARSHQHASSTKRFDHDQIQQPYSGENGALRRNQENAKQGSFETSHHHYSEASNLVNRFEKNEASASGDDSSLRIQGRRFLRTKESTKSQTESRMQNPSAPRNGSNTGKMNLNASTENGNQKQKYPHLTPDVREARRIFSLPFSQHSQLIQPKPFKDNKPLDPEKEYREIEALKLFDWHYPYGVPNLQNQIYTSPENRPLALQKEDDSMTPCGYRRKEKKHVNGRAEKIILD